MFIYYNGYLGMIFLEHLQQFCNGNAFGNCLNGANFKVCHGGSFGEKVGILNVDETNNVVFVFPEYRIAGEFIHAHKIKVGFKVILFINAQNFRTRRHDCLGVFVIQFENIV